MEVFQEMLTKREEMEEHKIEVKAMEEWKAAFKERKVAIEEEKLRIMGNKVVNKNLEREQKIMFMDTSCLDQQKAYVSTMRAVSWQHRWVVLKVGLRMEVMIFDELCHGRMVALLLIIPLLLILPFA